MKKMIVLGLVSLAAAQLVSADVVAGWDTWFKPNNNIAPGQKIGIKSLSADSIYGRLSYDDATNAGLWGRSSNKGSSDGTWGGYSNGVDDPSGNTGAGSDVLAFSTVDATAFFTISITNHADSVISLDQFSFDGWQSFNNSAGDWQLDLTANTLGLANTTLGTGSLTPMGVDADIGGINDFEDVNLTLSSMQLGLGDSVTLKFSLSGASNTSKTYIDNVALIGGSVIPEPATLGLIGVSGLGLLFFRRRFMM